MSEAKHEHVEALRKSIPPACLRRFADDWEEPGPEEVRAVLAHANLTGKAAALRLGIKDDRTVRRWTGGESNISYAAWALLCEIAGLGKIW